MRFQTESIEQGDKFFFPLVLEEPFGFIIKFSKFSTTCLQNIVSQGNESGLFY